MLGMAAMNTAQNAVGAGMGLILQGINDRRQLRQQEKLQNLQIKGQQQMVDYNYAKELQMWKDTNYRAQMAELKAAGLNPALMYKQGGPGGITGSPVGNVTGGQAPAGGMEIMNMMMTKAQLELMKAQTDKTKAEAGAIPTTIAKTEAETKSITQGIENQKVQAELMDAQRFATNVMSDINARSSNSQVASAARRVEMETEEVKRMMRENNIAEATIDEKINLIKLEAYNAYLTSIKTQQDTDKAKAEITNMQEQIKLGQGKLALEKAIADGSIINWKGGALEVGKRLLGSWLGKGKGGN